MSNYVTLLDGGYVLHGIAMVRSLQNHDPSAKVWVLCLDELAEEIPRTFNLAGVVLLPLRNYENESLREVKATRS